MAKFDAVVAFGCQPRRDLGGDVGLAPADEGYLATLERLGHGVGSLPRRPQHRHLLRVLHRPERADDLSRSKPAGLRDGTLELQEVRGPAAVRDRESRPASDEARYELGRLLVLRPRAHRVKARIVVHPRRLQLGNDQRRVVVCRHHEHRQALERHRLVAGQPWHVGPERQEEGVDLQFPHAVPHAREARRPCERVVGRGVGPGGIAHDTSAVSATAPARPEAATARLAW